MIIFENTDFFNKISFLSWSILKQRIVLVLIGFSLFFTINKQIFSGNAEMLRSYKKNVQELRHELNIREKVIKESALSVGDNSHHTLNDNHTLNVDYFFEKISEFSKRNHLEVQAIDPVPMEDNLKKNRGWLKRSFQISWIGKYHDFLKFIHEFITVEEFVILDGFQIKSTGFGNYLKLSATVDLYF